MCEIHVFMYCQEIRSFYTMLGFESLLFNVFISNIAKCIGLENMLFLEIGGGGKEFRSFYLPVILLRYTYKLRPTKEKVYLLYI